MAGYQPINIKANEVGLVQNRQEFILPEDAYPTLENAFIFREQIRRRQGYRILGRLSRQVTVAGATNSLLTGLGANAGLVPGSINITDSTATLYTDPLGNGALSPSGSVNYATGDLTGPTPANSGTFKYYPNLPVMGIRTQEQNPSNEEQTIFFDTKYAYVFDTVSAGFIEFITGTTWNGSDSQYFWSTNYWTTSANNTKLFWVTNFNYNGATADPIRYTDGSAWFDFSPTAFQGQLDETGNLFLLQALCLLPFRGRLLAFNTVEGPALKDAATKVYSNRIRWSQIGNPLISYAAAAPPNPVQGSWLDTVRGKGGFLDIPTNEDIISVGFVRDNLVIYCENSTWQLRYTGRSIAPFQIEKVNSELGVKATFSGVQFDTSIVGIGNRGIIECDSYQSSRIDIKIPDLIFHFNNEQINGENIGARRVHGIRDYTQKLAYWIYPFEPSSGTFPDRRLVYNYENKSWAIFTDSLTCLGNFVPSSSLTWENSDVTWEEANFTWIDKPIQVQEVVGGNQQGYIEIIGGSVDGGQTTNDESLYIKNITGFGLTPADNPVIIESPNHNLTTGQIIQVFNLVPSDPFYDYLEEGIYQITFIDINNFYLTVYNTTTQEYSDPALAPIGTYKGRGEIKVRDNFNVISKKFNYMDLGQQFQIGWIDILMSTTDSGAITMNIYTDYNMEEPTNTTLNQPLDTFFNSVIPTNAPELSLKGGSKNWHRAICPTNSNFITIEYTLNNEQMQNDCQSSDVQIDAQIIYARPGGRQGITS